MIGDIYPLRTLNIATVSKATTEKQRNGASKCAIVCIETEQATKTTHSPNGSNAKKEDKMTIMSCLFGLCFFVFCVLCLCFCVFVFCVLCLCFCFCFCVFVFVFFVFCVFVFFG